MGKAHAKALRQEQIWLLRDRKKAAKKKHLAWGWGRGGSDQDETLEEIRPDTQGFRGELGSHQRAMGVHQWMNG